MEMEFVYYFIGSLWGTTVVILLGFMLLKLKNIETTLLSTRNGNIDQNSQRLGKGIKDNE
jgi:hypothetical protein